MNHCKTCTYWRPLFTGEHWSVRSFMDAPAEAQAEIKARMAVIDKRDGMPMGIDAIRDVSGITIGGFGTETFDDIPDGPDWPEWGECVLTEMHNDLAKQSLARAMDGSRYHAVLRCHGNFGCIQWETFVD